MDNYTLYCNELNHLFETKYNRNGRYVKFIYNGYKNKTIMHNVSEFSSFVLIDTVIQSMTLCDNVKQVMTFVPWSDEDLNELNKDLDELLAKCKQSSNDSTFSAERMLLVLQHILKN